MRLYVITKIPMKYSPIKIHVKLYVLLSLQIILSIFFVCIITSILCRPADEPIAILKSETEGVNADGSYRYAYETANDIAVEESGI